MPDASSPEIADRTALDLRRQIAAGEVTAAEVAQAFLDRIAAREPEVRAFAWLDPERALGEAGARDDQRREGWPIGALHGVPVAVKDIIDTAGVPTENGTPLDAGRIPDRDAYVVAALRQAGAVLLGKTVTTELGAMHPRATRNPHHTGHTPGGSSSGSAAAVAAHMTPLAIGTQTNGSVIRPASFCGIVGYKPNYGVIPRTGILPQARPLDTVGVFARSVGDAALLVDALAGHDDGDPVPGTTPTHLIDAALAETAEAPVFAFIRSPAWEHAEATTQAAFEALAVELGPGCRDAELPPHFAMAVSAHTQLSLAGIALHYGHYYERGRNALSTVMRETIDRGRAAKAVDYLGALDFRDRLLGDIGRLLGEHEVILTPAAPGEAPEGIGSTGNPCFNTLWSLLGMPAISLPLLQGPKGLPVGVQLVARRGDDAALLRAAAWLMRRSGRG
jgi:Asp-tRNA(Asn)/Glu-tRNA(Gln) amidotransferase A subunit family amidase